MVLRLFNLLEGSNYAPYAVDAIRSILRLPHISFGSDVGKNQLLHHLRFSIDYLRRARLLDFMGKPINLFGIASDLYYTEPGNLAMTALLQSGVIHDICSQPDSIQAERDLVVLLCHLFCRRYLPHVYATASNVRDLVQKGPSRVVLPPLHPQARAVLIEHQKETLGIFGAYTLAFSSQHANELEPDDQLPLSGITFEPSGMSTRPQTILFAHLSQTANVWYDLESFHLVLVTIRGALEDLLLRTSRDAASLSQAAELGDIVDADASKDSGYHSLDPSQQEEEEAGSVDDGGEASRDPAAFTRPRGVSDRDWRVYEIFNSITNEFGVKFKAMWA